ncbi:MAG: hypothetical protein WB919_15385 [Candidatus Sulfotelmatobacter sp.]
MMPQSNLFVAAPLKMDREAELRSLLASMNVAPGVVNAHNKIVPFADFEGLHFARFVILRDETLEDIHTAYGLPRRDYPIMLAFIADFDGDADEFRAELSHRGAEGLCRIFSCCEDFVPGSDLACWMKAHEQAPAAAYVNRVGRTLKLIREDDALRLTIETYLQNNELVFAGKTPEQIRTLVKKFVDSEIAAGRIKLTRQEPTPFIWQLRRVLNLIGVPLMLIVLTPLLLLYLPLFIYQLRTREERDMEIAPRPSPAHEEQLARLEDNVMTNQFSAMGSIKPGLFRRWTLTFLLYLVNYSARHIYVRSHLARVPTIHFARWVFLDGKKRMLFASNYDGSLDSYMDDFINKVGWGLNLVFSNGIGYPTTNWLAFEGSKDEQKFKYFLRRHQLPTEVWYDAHPGLAAFDLKRNALIRDGIERDDMTARELDQWVALF